MAETVRGVAALHDEIEKAKESLKDVDENIKKLTGRDPTEPSFRNFSPGVRRKVSAVTDNRGRERLFLQARWGDEDGQARRRIVGGAFSRLGPSPGGGRRRGQDSGDEDELPNKPTIQSSVIATPNVRSRKDSIEEQKGDGKETNRNKRMFGLLLGTLRKFKDEAKETEDKNQLRRQVEQKLEEKAKEEKEEIKRERRQLFVERREKKARIRRLEYKVELVNLHEAWLKETRKLKNFPRTRAKPHIFFMPNEGSPGIEGKLQDSAKYVDEVIAEKQKKLEKEIEQLMNEGQDEEDEEEEGSGEKGEGEGDQYRDKENRARRRKSSGEGDHRRRSNEGHRGDRDSGRDRDGSRKRRKSETVDDDRHGGKHRRRSKEDEKDDRRRSGGKKDHSHHRKDSDKPRDRAEPKVEISYNDGEEEEEEQVGGAPIPVISTSVRDIALPSDNIHTVKGMEPEASSVQPVTDLEAKRNQAVMAEDAEEGEDEGRDMVDE